MKNRFLLGVLAVLALTVVAARAESDKARLEDVARHRAIAAAHEAAAKCIEAKKPEEVCAKELQAACKGLAIGKFCGMRHQH
jgi:16S rRNA G527 N7-methylase RsmG